MVDSYKTITSLSEGIYKEKGSKFVSFAMPVQDIVEISTIIKEYKKTYFDARHVCYAYMLGAERLDFRTYDDSEPSGTAGRPILGQINSRELTNVLVIVVRYFGGVLLGTSGLALAYKEAASDALAQTEIIEKSIIEIFDLHFDYLLLNDIMKIIKDNNIEVLKQKFDNQCYMQISIPKKELQLILSKFEKIFGLHVQNPINE
jgi:uncharacterized YigZ family protein